MILLKRIYEPYQKSDGFRVLVDRLWQRGISKDNAHIDIWFKVIAPSNELRKWAHQKPSRFEEFKSRYIQELEDNTEALKKFSAILDKKTVTFLYASKDPVNNHAIVLKNYLDRFR